MSKNTICNVCEKRRVVENGLCTPCQTEGEWENEHSDRGHDDHNPNMFGEFDEDYDQVLNEMTSCWVCHPELNEAQMETTPRKGHSNGIAKSYTSHKDCAHACTPGARAKCRKARAAK